MDASGKVMEFPATREAAGADPSWRGALGTVAAQLQQSRDVTHNIRQDGRLRHLPSPKAVAQIVDRLAAALFPTHYGEANLNPAAIAAYVDLTLAAALEALGEQVLREMLGVVQPGASGALPAQMRTEAILLGFAEHLPEIRNRVVGDLRAAAANDPVAGGTPEIMLTHPGLIAILHHRLGHALHRLGAPLVARLVSHAAQTRTGIDIHPGAVIGDGFSVDHGAGIVVGETAVIGARVRLFQNVTLGADNREAGQHAPGTPRHPVIEDDVVIHAGATLLGRITVGHHAVIGGNTWLTDSVAPHTVVTQARMRRDDA